LHPASPTPAPNPCSTPPHSNPALSELELSQRWGVSPKTLQRWRSEGRGPKYLKLSKRVTYPLSCVLDFETDALHASTSQKHTSQKVNS
jgi:predicted DNA-binding transcriptional regulator AlpA